MSSQSILIVGLGNPGPEYAQTRHNAGFFFIDTLLRKYGGALRPEKKFHGEIARISAEGSDVWLLQPLTFMNRSGQAIAAMASFYKIPPERIVVVHDELDLPPGTARLKKGGGHGGHNGLRDTIAQLGSKDFLRLRIGIGHPGHASQVTGFVLGKPSRDELIEIERSLDDCLDILPELVRGDLQKAMNCLHSR